MNPAPVVFITGASSGIGAALARAYAERGARLGLLGRNEAALARLAESLPGEHLTLVADVSVQAQIADATRRFVSRFGVPDVVIASAGVSVGTLTEYESDLADFEQVLRTNLLGMVATFQPFVEPMRRRGSGRLVGIASVAGIRGLPGAGAYSASKAGVISYLESLRVELHGSGVRVVTIAPGYIRTPMTDVNDYPMPFLMAPDAAARRMLGMIEAGRRFGVVPWQMAVVARLLAAIPRPVFDRLFSRAGRKPRGLPL